MCPGPQHRPSPFSGPNCCSCLVILNGVLTTLTLFNLNLAASTNLTPTITLGGLVDFANMSTEEMLQGIALFADGIFASQGVGDLRIPFSASPVLLPPERRLRW